MKANNPASLATIDSRQLQLWQVNILIGEDDVVPEMEEPYLKLSMGKKISDYFGTESSPEIISIMVGKPGKYNSFHLRI